MNAYPMIFQLSKADSKWAGFVSDLETIRAGGSAEISEFIVTHGPKLSPRSSKTDIIKILINTDIYYGSQIGDFGRIEQKDAIFALSSLGFVTSDDMGDRQKWLNLYTTFSPEVREVAAKKLVAEFEWDFSDCTYLIDDVLIGLKPMIKILKEHSDTVFLLDVNGDIDLPATIKQTMQQRAEAHYKQFESILKLA